MDTAKDIATVRRIHRGVELALAGAAERVAALYTLYTVRGSGEHSYVVSLEFEACSCKDFEHRRAVQARVRRCLHRGPRHLPSALHGPPEDHAALTPRD